MREGKPMSVFGGRRASPPAPGRARSEPRSDDAPVLAPHFQPAPLSAADLESLDEARRIVEELRVHLAELDRREQSLNSRLSQLDRDQRALRLAAQQLDADHRERDAALLDREQRLAEREAAVARLADEAAEQQAAVDLQQADVDRQRADFREEVWADVAEERRHLAEQRDAIAAQQAELEQERARFRDEVLAEFAAARRELAARQAEHEQERQRFREQVDAALATRQAELDAQCRELEQARADIAADAAEWQAAREREWTECTAQLEQRRQERLAEIEARDAAVSQREVDLVKRTRFQEEHLARLRSAIEAKQAELERHRAGLSVWNAEVEASIRGRLSHLRKFRDVLEQRESACDAAWTALADARNQQHALLKELREQIVVEQHALDEQQRQVAGDLRRHAELLRLREQEVERHSARNSRMQAEFDRRLRELEAREAAVAEACQRLEDEVGADRLLPLLAQAAPPVEIEPVLSEQQRAIEEAEQHLSRWHAELQRDREAFAELAADRERRLRIREAALGRQLEELAAREAELQAAQARDRAEREQAYAMLESLVGEIERRLAG